MMVQMSNVIRVIFRASDNGQKFPVYFRGTEGATIEEQVAEAAEKLHAVEISRTESSEPAMKTEQMLKLLGIPSEDCL
jgi:hypothetical protein